MSGKKYNKKKQAHHVLTGLMGICVAALLVLISFFTFQVDHYEVVGNYHETENEILESLMEGTLGHNAIYLALTNRNRKVEGSSFIDTLTVNMTSPRSVEVVVKEKDLVGYLRYRDYYWYFDRMGVVQALSKYSQAEFNQIAKGALPAFQTTLEKPEATAGPSGREDQALWGDDASGEAESLAGETPSPEGQAEDTANASLEGQSGDAADTSSERQSEDAENVPSEGWPEDTAEAPSEGQPEDAAEAPSGSRPEDAADASSERQSEDAENVSSEGWPEDTAEAPSEGWPEDAAEAPSGSRPEDAADASSERQSEDAENVSSEGWPEDTAEAPSEGQPEDAAEASSKDRSEDTSEASPGNRSEDSADPYSEGRSQDTGAEHEYDRSHGTTAEDVGDGNSPDPGTASGDTAANPSEGDVIAPQEMTATTFVGRILPRFAMEGAGAMDAEREILRLENTGTEVIAPVVIEEGENRPDPGTSGMEEAQSGEADEMSGGLPAQKAETEEAADGQTAGPLPAQGTEAEETVQADAGEDKLQSAAMETAHSTEEDIFRGDNGAVLVYIPFIEGLSFSEIEVGKSIAGVGSSLFDMLHTFRGYALRTGNFPDRIVIGQNQELSVFYGQAEVRLGGGEKLEVRLNELRFIDPYLKDLEGVLHLENFDGSQDEVIFSKK